jgi:hypothetical protein
MRRTLEAVHREREANLIDTPVLVAGDPIAAGNRN